ncbi:phosphatidylserine/phosphatidylglycerophosphate/cardiolipin synthase-like enzyme [Silvimonas terrae]|uniref:phospholipase D n=1 Tax=Silvimonas terrae TaxID=300266 RepID=A0A840RI96_9NEIS|nr:phospholipase D-like domain-containing protein [Silvimonas terrae]MBB5192160.1 phosphatidylserine/phosphatidylglycerophosphate/cardiolipin synthase-like enzyme [Silvimonas terrae]
MAVPKSVVIAVANNDVAQIVWRYTEKIPHCLGFAVQRSHSAQGDWADLPSWVGFTGQTNPGWTSQPTSVWPIQKFEWRDLTAERGQTYYYRIVPMTGTPDGPLTPLTAQALVTQTPVTLTPQRGAFQTFFNRGILSTQYVAHALPQGTGGGPSAAALKDRIDQPGSPLRQALAGQIIEGLTQLLDRARTQGGTCYAALYELNDPELLQKLLGSEGLQLILSNAGTDDDTNRGARQDLHDQAGVTVIDRFVPSGHIGHNKFCVYTDQAGKAQAVLLGSTNWTDTGVCAQSNNALIVENPQLANAYLTYWQRLEADTKTAGARQGPQLRESDMQPGASVSIDQAHATVWFSPNTPHARVSHPANGEAVPPDLAAVFELMDQAQQAILFLEFEPGHPSVVDHAAACLNKNPGLFVRGAVTDPGAVGDFSTTLIHRGGDATQVIAASAIGDQFAFWQKELLKSAGGHAIIHSKIVVIDPASDHCVVVTGSHNQGYRASYNNDENLLIVQGHRELAAAYAVNIMDVYDHYRFRSIVNQQGSNAFSGLARDDAWQDKYFDPASPTQKDDQVWFAA